MLSLTLMMMICACVLVVACVCTKYIGSFFNFSHIFRFHKFVINVNIVFITSSCCGIVAEITF